jgi:hypothetical protein
MQARTKAYAQVQTTRKSSEIFTHTIVKHACKVNSQEEKTECIQHEQFPTGTL